MGLGAPQAEREWEGVRPSDRPPPGPGRAPFRQAQRNPSAGPSKRLLGVRAAHVHACCERARLCSVTCLPGPLLLLRRLLLLLLFCWCRGAIIDAWRWPPGAGGRPAAVRSESDRQKRAATGIIHKAATPVLPVYLEK